MKVALVHYHLEPGGVTRVIECASRAMWGAGIGHVILTGKTAARRGMELPVREVAGLGYGDSLSPQALLAGLRAAAAAALGGMPDLWHFHNHSLGKNQAVTEVVSLLAADGERLLLQIHDLAEDGRPENAPLLNGCANPYPIASHVHYAFINTRDLRRFTGAGLPEGNAHLLANPCSEDRPATRSDSDVPLLLYPVRGIRRKNLGELLLLMLLAPPGSRAAITRAPHNPLWRPIHDDWRSFAWELELPVDFDVVDRMAPVSGGDCSFDSWLGHATHLVTTSVAEGFGMVHLDALAWRKPLLGREIPHLAADLQKSGVHVGAFYQKIGIPASWVDVHGLESRKSEAIREILHAWRHALPSATAPHGHGAFSQSHELDFGNLPELIQQQIIRRIAAAPQAYTGMIAMEVMESGRCRTFSASEWLARTLSSREVPAEVAGLSNFEMDAYQEKLAKLHGNLMRSQPGDVRSIDAARVQDAYFDPDGFRFLAAPGIETRPEADFAVLAGFQAVVFDVYGTLRIAAAGGVKPDPDADPVLRGILSGFGCRVPDSPSSALHEAVRRHHAESHHAFPEVDLRELWCEVAAIPEDVSAERLMAAVEEAWHPSSWMPGAVDTLRRLHELGIPLGLLSNAQCDMLPSLGEIADWFAPDLVVLSYQHRIAKPSPELFSMMAAQLAARGIAPDQTLYIGNDPRHDIGPAAACGFKTALFAGHPDSLRPGYHPADFILRRWPGIS